MQTEMDREGESEGKGNEGEEDEKREFWSEGNEKGEESLVKIDNWCYSFS